MILSSSCFSSLSKASVAVRAGRCCPASICLRSKCGVRIGSPWNLKTTPQSDKLDLQTLSQEHSFLLSSPCNVISRHLHLQFSRRSRKVVDQGPDWKKGHTTPSAPFSLTQIHRLFRLFETHGPLTQPCRFGLCDLRHERPRVDHELR